MLTSLTTFFGLAPMIFETSVQARFLIPMAISLGFGILFATAIILVLLPALYLMLEDMVSLLQRFLHLADLRGHQSPETAGGPGDGGGGNAGASFAAGTRHPQAD